MTDQQTAQGCCLAVVLIAFGIFVGAAVMWILL